MLPKLPDWKFTHLIFQTAQSKMHALIFSFIAVSIIFIGVIVDQLNNRQFLVDLRSSLRHQMHTLQAQLEGDIISKALLMRGFAATIASNPDISQKRYAFLASQLIMDDPTIINIAAAPDMVVRYVYPLEPNKAVLGFDYRQSKAQLKEVERARLINGTVLAGPVDLVQGGRGLIVRSPVFTVNEVAGKRVFWGIVSIVVNMEMLSKNLDDNNHTRPLEIALRRNNVGSDFKVFYGDARIYESNPLLSTITLPNGSWRMAAIPKGGWPTHADNYLPFRIFLLTCGILLFLLALYIHRLIKSRIEAEHILVSAVNAIDDGYALYDADGKFVFCNEKYKKLYNLSADLFVLGTTFEHIIRESVKRGEYPNVKEADQEEWILQRLERHKIASLFEEHQLPNGRWLRISERRMADGGKVGIHIDITELKLATEIAEQASIAKTNFLNTLSHELRTPLTIILGHARILENYKILPAVAKLQTAVAALPADPDSIQAKLDKVLEQVSGQGNKICSSGSHLFKLISDILDSSKISAGEMTLDKQIFYIGPLIASVLEQFNELAKNKNIELSHQTNGETVFADEIRTKQILINLIGNAIKFTDAGSIKISTRLTGSTVEFIVEDTGCGIPEDEIDSVFTEFHQVDGTETRKANGTGLGLSIVKRMVELQGGEVGLTSTLGKGSTFRFTLPANEDLGKALHF